MESAGRNQDDDITLSDFCDQDSRFCVVKESTVLACSRPIITQSGRLRRGDRREDEVLIPSLVLLKRSLTAF